jgi:putative ATP-binding cassette transporter
MSGLRFVLQAFARASLSLVALGIAGAAFNAGLIAVVHRALDGAGRRGELAIAFVALALGKAISAYASGRIADSYSQTSIAKLRRELIGKLLAVPYQRLERLGAARAYAALTTDVMTVNSALQATANGLINAAVLAGGALYLLYLDARVFAALLVLAAAGFAVYQTLSTRARALLRKARAEHDRLFSHFRALTEGAKELKLHAGRRRAFLDGPLRETADSLVEHSVRSNARYLLVQATNSLLVLTAIGVALFGVGGGGAAGAGVASGYVLAALYLTGPLSSLLRLSPVFAAAEIALQRIRDAGVELGRDAGTEPEAEPGATAVFGSVELREVTHRYDEGAAFTLGPLSLRITPGEIVFVTGGNGSGKSTLARVLVGLYEPAAGQVVWDGEMVTAARRDTYRQLFSAVFSEFHVFEKLYGLPIADADVRALLTELGLQRVVEVHDGMLSSVDLSRGQRKRLALLTALLEDRAVYVFDEWAADQDADFKQHFYRRLLPQLRQRGKAVVVISHDDRWFDVADRVLELREGRLAGAAHADPSSRSARYA